MRMTARGPNHTDLPNEATGITRLQSGAQGENAVQTGMQMCADPYEDGRKRTKTHRLAKLGNWDHQIEIW
eukprot:4931667-Prymnesium_polylepis.1